MAIQLDDSAVRAQLHADIASAWGSLRAIHDQAPELPGKASDLPRAFILISAADFDLGIGYVQQSAEYRVTFQGLWAAGTPIHSQKVTRANALLAVLTAARHYAGGNWAVKKIEFSDSAVEKTAEPIFEVTVVFSVETFQSLSFP